MKGQYPKQLFKYTNL